MTLFASENLIKVESKKAHHFNLPHQLKMIISENLNNLLTFGTTKHQPIFLFIIYEKMKNQGVLRDSF